MRMYLSTINESWSYCDTAVILLCWERPAIEAPVYEGDGRLRA